MKLGVTTLGCPDWTLNDILTRCRAYGYEGIELRGLGPDLDLTRSPDFASPQAVALTKRKFDDAGLAVCGVDSSARLGDDVEAVWTAHRDEARRAMDLAVALSSPFVRVFGGGGTAALAAERLHSLGEAAAQTGGTVTVLLETHDAFSTGAQVAEVMLLADHPCVGALWDLHHPYRQGEAPEQTWDALGPWVRLTHVKDSYPGGTYCLLGDGDIPVPAMLRLLGQGGYDGWINLEWEKRWHPNLAAPEIAFPQYAQALRRLLAEPPA